MTPNRHKDDRMGRLAEVVTRNRYDPERLAAFKRVVTGATRCPECDELNRADHATCDKCGAKLYPDHKKKKTEEKI